jgi:quercetin dioxygenase-like cupin family protein
MSGPYQLLKGAASFDAGAHPAWGSLNLYADAETLGLEEMTLGRVIISAGRSNPLHIHDNCIEVVTLLTGRLLHVVADETFEMEAGDVLAVAAGLAHRAEAIGGSDAEMVIAYTSGRRAYREAD